MSIIHAAIGICIIFDLNSLVLVGICVFIFVYENTSGLIAYQYATETCCDISLGMCILTLYLTVLFLSLITNPLMEGPLQP